MADKKGFKKKKRSKLWIIIFILGLAVLLYPLFSRIYYDYRGNEEGTSFRQGLDNVTSAEVEESLNLAYAYNSSLLSGENTRLGDPFSDEDKEAGLVEYARMLEVNEKLGVVTIPRINMDFPIYAGTNESVLQKGVGHLEGTSFPIGGLNTHSVLTAHRGLPENKLFTDLDKMEIEDLFFVETLAGELAYKVIEIKVIEPTEINELTINENQDLVTLLTCTPYMINSHRLLVVGERTEVLAEMQEELTDISWWQRLLSLLNEYKWILLVLVIIVLYYLFTRKKKKSEERE